jgi:hypothetical protein
MLESFWQGLLSDPTRLSELAGKLSDSARPKPDVDPLEKRLGAIEAQLRDLHDGLASVITYLEALPGAAGAAKKEPQP